MKIDKIFKIKEKYFNAILRFEKPFELRHQEIPENSIVKLECENGRYLIFKNGKCKLLIKNNHLNYYYTNTTNNYSDSIFDIKEAIYYKNSDSIHQTWYDTFCWEYITKAPTYLIEIAEILEVK